MIVCAARIGYGKAAPSGAAPARLSWDALRRLDLGRACVFTVADHLTISAGLPWGRSAMLDVLRAALWARAAGMPANAAELAWDDLRPLDLSNAARWDKSITPRALSVTLIYDPSPAWRDKLLAITSRRSDELSQRLDAAAQLAASLYVPTSALAFSFAGQHYSPPTAPQVFFDFRYTLPARRSKPLDGASSVRWSDARKLNRAARLPWGKGRALDGERTGIVWPDYTGPVKPLPEPPKNPELEDTYMIVNEVTMLALPSRTPIEAQGIRIALDADSYSWSLSADIFTRAALDLIRPSADAPGQVEVQINGHRWVFIVERYSRNLRFAKEAYSITGASRTQLLAAPYAPLTSAANNAQINSDQAADEQLTNTGFSLTWGAAVWPFPAGSLSWHGQSAMQVIAKMADTVGAFVRPARFDDALEVLPRYPAQPWEWQQIDAPISKIIPPAMMTDLSGEWTPHPQYNACYTTGVGYGVSMLVRRNGTAGDLPAPDVADEWLTDQVANQARGTYELARSGAVELVGITLPLFPLADDHGIGLVLPGQLCRVPEDSGSWVGLCLAVEITADGVAASKVSQKITLERNHSWLP